MRRTMFHRVLALAVALALVLPLAGPVLAKATKSYVVVLAGDPIATYGGGIAGLAATRAERGKKVDPDSATTRKYERHLKAAHAKSLKEAGAASADKVHDYTFSLNGYSAILTKDEAEAIANQKGVLRVLEDQMRQPQTDSSGEFLGLTVKHGAYDSGYTGEDVVVGVIDTGIWPEHPSFADDGSYGPSPIPPVPCEFGNTAHNVYDVPFTCNNKLLGARQVLDTYRFFIGAEPEEFDSARDEEGHGTHTASTAAGNANVAASVFGQPLGTISGIAPRARIIAYKALGEQGGFTSDLAGAIDQAVEDGVDVINYSVGSGASLPGADDIAFLFAADAGVFVATSAGNSGPDAGTVGSPAVMPWVTTVGASTQTRFFEGQVTLGNGRTYEGASITRELGMTPLVDGATAGSELCLAGELNPTAVAGKIVLCLRGVSGRIAKGEAVFDAGGVGMILYNASDVDNLFTDNHFVPTVHIDNKPGLAIKAYIASARDPRARITTRTRKGGPIIAKWKPAPSMTIFSSRGPNVIASDLIKPDVTAPGLQILAGMTPRPTAGQVPGELFQAIAGTSMSSPHVAGVFALLKQAHPDWSAAMAKSALMTTADPKVVDNDRKTRADPFDMGAGHINPGGKWNKKGSLAQPGLVYDAGLFEYAAFTCGEDFGIFSPGSCDFLEAIGVPTNPYDLNVPSIGVSSVVGSQTIIRTVTSVTPGTRAIKYQAKVHAPDGYTVSVSPSTIKLAGGESATFTVTFTNVSAPVGAWRFGDLTWKGGGYDVRSPIAVRGAEFQAPDNVSGTGTSGSVSFPVKFGYNGSYAAAAHGLAPATVTHATVSQDVDQTFDPTDVATGGANLHQFTLSDASLFRIALPPEATDASADLDIFVYDPSGSLFASSTAGGTNELINIADPADGVWSVYVHGWQTAGPSSTYDMWSWAVPNASGGSLSISSAPTSATLGGTGTVTAEWTGIGTGAIGDWYLGAVSHTGPSGLLGHTYVNVDNRP